MLHKVVLTFESGDKIDPKGHICLFVCFFVSFFKETTRTYKRIDLFSS